MLPAALVPGRHLIHLTSLSELLATVGCHATVIHHVPRRRILLVHEALIVRLRVTHACCLFLQLVRRIFNYGLLISLGCIEVK